MKDAEKNAARLCAIYVDMGTTNTRVWLMLGDEVLSRAELQVGVRDAAQAGSATRLRTTLKELITRVQQDAEESSKSCVPVCVLAAGMIGSALGLAELAHIPAPAGMRELSQASVTLAFPDVTPLPFLLVPGVRSESDSDFSAPNRFDGGGDVMRGEETLCVGLHALGLVEPPAVVLTLGSHWKAIRLDAEGRIENSVTSLTGEMIQAVQTRTILASSVSAEWPETLSPDWLTAGMEEQRRAGLARALFCVRLLELERQGTADDRFAFLLGAFIASDLDSLVAGGAVTSDFRVLISGHAATATAWAFALAQQSMSADVLTRQQTESAFLAGLKQIFCANFSGAGISSSGSSPGSAA